GERAHIFIAGEYSHSVMKGAMLDGPDTGDGGLYREERMTAIQASAAELEMSRSILATARDLLTASSDGEVRPEPFLYARVDLVSSDEGAPVLMELEMVEPSLFMALGDAAVDRFTDAILARCPDHTH